MKRASDKRSLRLRGEQICALIDAVVRADRGAAGIEGAVALGFAKRRTGLWWVARFSGGRVVTSTSRLLAEPVDVAVVVDERDASAILAGSAGRSPRVRLVGQSKLWERFARRYFGERMSAVRARMYGG